MFSNVLYILFLILLNLTKHIYSEDSSNGCFRAAVYEHILVKNPADKVINSLDILAKNYLIFERVVKRASFIDTKFLVFPEYALLPSLKRDEMLHQGAIPLLPDLNINLCSIYKKEMKSIIEGSYTDVQKGEKMQILDEETTQIKDQIKVNKAILRKLSCLAEENNIYLAINLVTLEINGLNDENSYKSDKVKLEENLELSKTNSELDALKLSDKLINEKLTDQLNKISSKDHNSKDDYRFFNTELVFDNKGKLIAIYKKYNLKDAKDISKGELKTVAFKTEFGKFGLSIGEDILFENPIKKLVEEEKIDHLIHSGKWNNELPSLSSLSMHSSNSAKYGINILSANHRNFKSSEMGSSIVNGKNGVRVQSSFDNHDRLLVADLPIGSVNNNNDDSAINLNEKIDIETLEYSNLDPFDPNSKVDVNEYGKAKCSHFEPVRIAEETYQELSYVFKDNTFLIDYKGLQTPMSLFKTKRLENTEGKISELCDKSVCCELEWKMNDKFNFASDNYYLIANSRLKKSDNDLVARYEESCALVSYHQSKNEYKIVASTHFDKLNLRGKFNTTEIFPNILSSALYTIPKHKWTFKQVYNEAELSFTNIKRPITFATLYGRIYEKDEIVSPK